MSSEPKNTRAKILDATWKMLEEGTPQAVRMADIARLAGVSRQALYLHFKNRTDLIRATRDHIDQVNDLDARLKSVFQSQDASTMLDAYIEVWGGYLPLIKGVASALLAASDVDEAAKAAWGDCMTSHRTGCATIVNKMHEDAALAPRWNKQTAQDFLWAQLSFEQWHLLTQSCSWSTQEYSTHLKAVLHDTLMR